MASLKARQILRWLLFTFSLTLSVFATIAIGWSVANFAENQYQKPVSEFVFLLTTAIGGVVGIGAAFYQTRCLFLSSFIFMAAVLAMILTEAGYYLKQLPRKTWDDSVDIFFAVVSLLLIFVTGSMIISAVLYYPVRSKGFDLPKESSKATTVRF